MSTTARVLDLARRRFDLEPGTLKAEDDLFDALGIDSVEVLDLLSQVEQDFGIELPDYELAEVRSFADLANKIEERL